MESQPGRWFFNSLTVSVFPHMLSLSFQMCLMVLEFGVTTPLKYINKVSYFNLMMTAEHTPSAEEDQEMELTALSHETDF